MSRRGVEHSFRFQAYLRALIACQYDGLTRDEVAKKIGVSKRTLYSWERKKIDWEYVRDERRKLFAVHTIGVDAALIEDAKKPGNNEARKLYYQRFDGWIPTEASVAYSGKNKESDEKLMTELAEIYARVKQGQDDNPRTEAQA